MADAQSVAPEPALSGARLDRAAQLRTGPETLARLLRAPDARAVFAHEDAVLVSADGSALSRLFVPELRERAPLLLGLEADGALFGVDLGWLDDHDRDDVVRQGHLLPLREAGIGLPPDEGGLAAYLLALSNWHRDHTHCSNCGAPTDVREGGLSRHCPRCDRSHFPRTDPVVIMLVEHDGRLLLGRRPIWPRGRYSLLAGFVAPGETPEEAVAREVREESAIEVMRCRYVASQPWPFPASLMLGYFATSRGGTPRCLDGELDDVRWFSRAEVEAARSSSADWSSSPTDGHSAVLLPPPVSIARWLIEWWLTEGASGG
ncbi:MAG TPA: NAD(+) diphosphatase [Solirubrobacteraceae bacterium]|nr:NAD(+) diphosphatase [Solirubrobacteraceae bacterium]